MRLYVLLACFFAPAVFSAAKSPSFVPQTVIDGYVDRAFYLLNSSSDPASGITQERAIDSAKSISAKLRSIAQTDANAKYILWKVNELDGQIYLEEKGLLEEREQYRQKSVNDLIPQFNAALGKQRPDFAVLWRIHSQVKAFDPDGMAIDMENSIRKRAYALAREIPYNLEADLDNGEIETARAALGYCRVNATYLGFSPAGYAAIEAKFAAKTTAIDDRTVLAASLERFKEALTGTSLADGRREMRLAGEKIRVLRTRMVAYEWNRYNKDFELFSSKLLRKEDSLVDAAVSLLKEQGPSAASDYLETMRSRGVAADRVAKFDRLILETVVAQKQKESRASPGPAVVDSAVGADGTADNFALSDIMSQAKKRSSARKDSLVAVREERGRTTQVEEVRRERLRVANSLREMREKDIKKTDAQLALEALIAIYTKIELKKPDEAKLLFEKSKELLRKNIPAEDFTKVSSAVGGT
ncbi:MAG: hypothetical protein MUF22_00470 [Chitinispirillaceae bacterium]|jgi:hypothetical protein|nr:hypothetical protein [Chitinispirillaceae bacterium]